MAGSVMRYEQPMLVTPIHGFGVNRTPDFDRTMVQRRPVLSYSLFDAGRDARVRQNDAEAAVPVAAVLDVEQALVTSVVAGYLTVRGRAEVFEAHEYRFSRWAAAEVGRDAASGTRWHSLDLVFSRVNHGSAAEQHRPAKLEVPTTLDRALAALDEARARVASLETAVARSETSSGRRSWHSTLHSAYRRTISSPKRNSWKRERGSQRRATPRFWLTWRSPACWAT